MRVIWIMMILKNEGFLSKARIGFKRRKCTQNTSNTTNTTYIYIDSKVFFRYLGLYYYYIIYKILIYAVMCVAHARKKKAHSVYIYRARIGRIARIFNTFERRKHNTRLLTKFFVYQFLIIKYKKWRNKK